MMVRSLALLLLVPLVGLASDPALKGDFVTDEGKMLRLSVENLPPKATVLWDHEGLDSEETGVGKIVLTGLPSSYSVRATVIWLDGDRVGTKRLNRTVTVNPRPQPPTPPVPPGPNPVPPNPVPPGPKPEPTPVQTYPDAWFFVIEETKDRTEDTARVLDFILWHTLPIQTGHWRFYDRDSPDVTKYGYLRLADKLVQESKSSASPLKYPLVLALKSAKDGGGLIEATNLPTDKNSLKTFVLKIVGTSK